MIALSVGDSALFHCVVQDSSVPLQNGGFAPLNITGMTVQLMVYQRGGTAPGTLLLTVVGTVTDGPNGKGDISMDHPTSLTNLPRGTYDARFCVLSGGTIQYTFVRDALQVS